MAFRFLNAIDSSWKSWTTRVCQLCHEQAAGETNEEAERILAEHMAIDREAWERQAIDAARALLPFLHDPNGEAYATDLLYRTPATILREKADRIERESRAICKLRAAMAHLDAATGGQGDG